MSRGYTLFLPLLHCEQICVEIRTNLAVKKIKKNNVISEASALLCVRAEHLHIYKHIANLMASR